MSILPTTAQGSTSYSSVQSPSPNPNPPIHGNPHHHRHFNHRRGNPPLPPRSIPSPPSPPPSIRRSGELASAGDDSCEPSKKVTEFVSPDVQTSFSHHNGDSQSPSPPGSGGVGSARSRGKISPTDSSPQSLQSTGNTLGGGPPSSGRRAQMMNANHLLNFHYDPIIRSQPRAPPPPPRRQRKIKPYNRDLFLQANYKFVVLDTGSYSVESMDPDKMLTWEDIICVRYSTPFPVQCPICLEHPLCSQITSCGHIFCFPCILQYLLMGKEDLKGDHFKRCPLCFEMVSPKDLYTIYIENVKQYHVGDTVEFMLLTRQKDSFTPSQKHMHETNAIPNCNDDIYDPFSKFKLTSDVELSVRKAMSDLDGWLARADSGLVDDIEKLPYVCAAMEHLEQRKKYWNEQRAFNNDRSSTHTDYKKGSQEPPTNANSTTVQDETFRSRHALPPNNVLDENNWQDNDTADGLGVSEGQDAKLSSSYGEDKGFQRLSNGTLDVKDHDSYNFYQAADGQHLILHPLNMKCLLHHYGSYDKLPHRLCGKILQLETVTQSEAIRRRYRYLSHFSLTTTFKLCEIDMSSMLPPDALLPFMDEIKKREKLRKQLAKKEWKEKMKAEAVAAYSIPNINSFGQSFYNESPQFSMDDFEALGSSKGMSSSPLVVGERLLFSNVARLGFAAGHDSPSLKIEEISSQKTREGDDSSSATGSRNSEPPSFANVISKAKSVQALDTLKTNETGKKGKKPSRVLLSTASGRRY